MRQLLSLLILLASVALARADGSIDFNGTTSKAENTTGNVLNDVEQITVCAWTYADGMGEGSLGVVFDIGAGTFGFRHDNSANKLNVHKLGTTTGEWNFAASDNQWNAVAVRLDFSADNAPTIRVNFAPVSLTTESSPVGIQGALPVGYLIGNRSNQARTWDGRLAYIQVFNAILSDADCDQTLRVPGSVTTNRRLYVRMLTSTDLTDQSGNGFNASGTSLATGAGGPPIGNFPQVIFGLLQGKKSHLVCEVKR
jgi:hypothetical protein